MKTYAQIVDGKVWGIFEYEKLPDFAPNIIMIDITGRDDVKTGMEYDGKDFKKPHQPKLTLQEKKENKIRDLYNSYQTFFNNYINSYPQGEVETFQDKAKEAIAWSKDNSISTPICDAIATSAGVDREVYLKSVLEKINYLANQEGAMLKVRNNIKASTTVTQLNKIKIPIFPIK